MRLQAEAEETEPEAGAVGGKKRPLIDCHGIQSSRTVVKKQLSFEAAEKPRECFDSSARMESPMISKSPPFVLRLAKDERKLFQQTQIAA